VIHTISNLNTASTFAAARFFHLTLIILSISGNLRRMGIAANNTQKVD